jgi:nucleoid-associated protein YgaU
MTSDAKVGLLLGLVFIFMIAFIINGLPNLREHKNNNELTTNMVSLEDNVPGLAAKQRKVNREVINQLQPEKKRPSNEIHTPSSNNENIRFTAPLPNSISAVKPAGSTLEVKSSGPQLSKQAVAEKNESPKIVSPKLASPKIYTVKEGDSLWQIAAEQLGDPSRYVEITRMNANVLDDEDRLVIGMRLKLPAR